jgi:hypothetical protein
MRRPVMAGRRIGRLAPHTTAAAGAPAAGRPPLQRRGPAATERLGGLCAPPPGRPPRPASAAPPARSRLRAAWPLPAGAAGPGSSPCRPPAPARGRRRAARSAPAVRAGSIPRRFKLRIPLALGRSPRPAPAGQPLASSLGRSSSSVACSPACQTFKCALPQSPCRPRCAHLHNCIGPGVREPLADVAVVAARLPSRFLGCIRRARRRGARRDKRGRPRRRHERARQAGGVHAGWEPGGWGRRRWLRGAAGAGPRRGGAQQQRRAAVRAAGTGTARPRWRAAGVLLRSTPHVDRCRAAGGASL